MSRASGRVVYGLNREMLAAIVNYLEEDSKLALACREVFARGGRKVDVSGPNLTEQATAVHGGFWH